MNSLMRITALSAVGGSVCRGLYANCDFDCAPWAAKSWSIAIAFIPPLAFAQPFNVWLYRALVMLLVACPCALVISTPVSIVSAIGAATRQGVLFKGGNALEIAGRMTFFEFKVQSMALRATLRYQSSKIKNLF